MAKRSATPITSKPVNGNAVVEQVEAPTVITEMTPPGEGDKREAKKPAVQKSKAGSTKKVKAGGKPKTKPKPKEKEDKGERTFIQRPYPQRTLEDALKIPLAIKKNNHGHPFATTDVAHACDYTNVRSSGFVYLVGSSRDYGLTIGNFSTEKIELTELGRGIVYAPDPDKERQGKIEAFFKVDIFKKVFDHYGGSKLPEATYLSNTLANEYNLLPDLHDEFVKLFTANCKYLGIETGLREGESTVVKDRLKEKDAADHADIRLVGQPRGKFDRTAFVIMPFSEKGAEQRPPGFFQEVLETLITPAANEVGFAVETAEQHGSDVIQQTIINRLLEADLVIADLTDHNPNVLFELGIRMAKELPVQLIRASGTKPIFDVDNMMRVFSYSPTLWHSHVQKDRPRMADHIKATWDNKSVTKTYMQILVRGEAAKT